MNISEKNETKGLITWRISARAEVSARLTELEKKTRLHGKFQPGLKLNVRVGTVVFIFIVVHKGSTHVFMNFQPGLKFLVDYMGNFSAINRAEDLISGSSNRLKFSSCNRKLRFTRILWETWDGNQAQSSSRAENPHVISP